MIFTCLIFTVIDVTKYANNLSFEIKETIVGAGHSLDSIWS